VALIVINHLIKKYNVSINDINQDKVISYQKCYDAYKSRIKQLEAMLGKHHAKRFTLLQSMPSHESKDQLTINIDFVQLLNAIACQYHVSLNEPNVMLLDNGNF